MRNKAFIQTIAVLIFLATTFSYQSVNYAKSKSLKQVDKLSRVQHAKELLGKRYRGSLAQKAEQVKNLEIEIFEDVYENLPEKFKNKAVALTETIISEAESYDLDPIFIMAIIKTESNFNPLTYGSHGEIGLMQIKPTTAEWLTKVKDLPWRGAKGLENPIYNVKIGVAYMADLRERSEGFANKYLSAYNMGLRKVNQLYKKDSAPQEYSLKVMKNYKEIYARIIADSSGTTISMQD